MVGAAASAGFARMAWGDTGLPVDTVVCFAVDVSGSVDDRRFKLQREGYMEALRHPAVMQAIRSTTYGRIGVCYYEWSGVLNHNVIIPWTEVAGLQDIEPLCEVLATTPRGSNGSTALAHALRYARGLFEECPWPGARKVLDVSGDGRDDNADYPQRLGYVSTRDEADLLIAAGVTVNGLPIPEGSEAETIVEWYRNNVVGGPGAFCMPAVNYESLAFALRNKFIMEVANGNT
jgi:hypothetical protein